MEYLLLFYMKDSKFSCSDIVMATLSLFVPPMPFLQSFAGFLRIISESTANSKAGLIRL